MIYNWLFLGAYVLGLTGVWRWEHPRSDAQVRCDMGWDRNITREDGLDGRAVGTNTQTHTRTTAHHRSVVRSAFSHLVDPFGFAEAVRMCLVADARTHRFHALGGEPEPALRKWENLSQSGPFIYHRRWWERAAMASGGRRPTWTAWQGSRRSTSDVKTARQTLSSVTLVTHASSASLEEPRNAGQYSIVGSTDMMVVVLLCVVMMGVQGSGVGLFAQRPRGVVVWCGRGRGSAPNRNSSHLARAAKG